MSNIGALVASNGVLAMSRCERDYSSVMRQIEGGLGKKSAAAKLARFWALNLSSIRRRTFAVVRAVSNAARWKAASYRAQMERKARKL